MSTPIVPEPVIAVDDEVPWRRFHPLTTLVRLGFAGVAVVAFVGNNLLDDFLSGDSEGQEVAGAIASRWLLFGSIALAAVLVITGLMALSWWVTTFRLTGDMVEMRRGVLFRSHRQVRLDRIAAVDIRRPILARLVGLSGVAVRTSGQEGDMQLDFLTQANALQVRDTLRQLSAQFVDGTEAPTDAAPAAVAEHLTSTWSPPDGANAARPPVPVSSAETLATVRIPPARLIGAAILGPLGITVVGSLGTAAVSFFTDTGAARYGAFGFLFAAVGLINGQVLSKLNFTLDAGASALTRQQGLLELTSTTIPYRRITAIQVRQPLLWRPFGWWTIDINQTSSGGIQGDSDEGGNEVLPVGNDKDLHDVLALLADELPEEILQDGLTGSGADRYFAGSTSRARRFDWFSWRRTGYHLSPSAALLRSGRLGRSLQIIPFARIQSYDLSQGPLERRARLAGVTLTTTQGPVDGAIQHLEESEASQLIAAVDSLARQARAARRSAS